MESILNSVKAKLGIQEKQVNFDDGQLIDFINSAFMTLYMLGVGPQDSPYYIEDDSNTWDEFIQNGLLESVKTYVYLKTKIVFDPPSSGTLMNALQQQLNETEWRLNVMVDK